jgi:Cys-tRNA synthase (O-phospho-L-seryl-tRNA:Cys-tRNA synthase)
MPKLNQKYNISPSHCQVASSAIAGYMGVKQEYSSQVLKQEEPQKPEIAPVLEKVVKQP